MTQNKANITDIGAEAVSVVSQLGADAKSASAKIAQTSIETIDAVLNDLAAALKTNAEKIIDANKKDLELAQEKNLPPALIDRLTISSTLFAIAFTRS